MQTYGDKCAYEEWALEFYSFCMRLLTVTISHVRSVQFPTICQFSLLQWMELVMSDGPNRLGYFFAWR
jgi:hypothetical protein